MFDRAAILRSAHALVRFRMGRDRVTRSYRQMLADALRVEWCNAKMAAAEAAAAAAETAIELPDEIAARCDALRLEASYEPHTFGGHDRFNALHREADKIKEAALAAIQLSSMGGFHLVAR